MYSGVTAAERPRMERSSTAPTPPAAAGAPTGSATTSASGSAPPTTIPNTADVSWARTTHTWDANVGWMCVAPGARDAYATSLPS